MRPKPITTSPVFTVPPPPPPSSKLLDEHEISDDFRRSIDAALKGLEAIYQTSPTTSSSNHTQEIPVQKTLTTNILPKLITEDHTANLTEIVHQISKQEKVISESISQIDIQPKIVGLVDDVNEIMLDSIEATTQSEIGNPMPPIHYETIEKLVTIIPNESSVESIKKHEEISESKENLLIITPS